MFIGQLSSMMVPGYMHAHAPYSMPPYATHPYSSNYLCPLVTPPSFVLATTSCTSTSVSVFIPTTPSYPLLQNTFQTDDIDDNN